MKKEVAKSWLPELESNPKLIELSRRVAARKRELKNDKEFVIETAKLRTRLEWGLAHHPKYLRRFLHHFSDPVGPRLPELKDSINSIRSARLRRLLKEYVKYVARFGVVVRLRKEDRCLFFEPLVPWG